MLAVRTQPPCCEEASASLHEETTWERTEAPDGSRHQPSDTCEWGFRWSQTPSSESFSWGPRQSGTDTSHTFCALSEFPPHQIHEHSKSCFTPLYYGLTCDILKVTEAGKNRRYCNFHFDKEKNEMKRNSDSHSQKMAKQLGWVMLL